MIMSRPLTHLRRLGQVVLLGQLLLSLANLNDATSPPTFSPTEVVTTTPTLAADPTLLRSGLGSGLGVGLTQILSDSTSRPSPVEKEERKKKEEIKKKEERSRKKKKGEERRTKKGEERRKIQASEVPIDPKVLVIVYGTLRGGVLAWESFSEHVLDYYKADLALLTPVNEHNYFDGRIKYDWRFDEREDWSKVFDETAGNEFVKTNWRSLCDGHEALVLEGMLSGCTTSGLKNSGGIQLAMRELSRRHIEELRLNQQYDFFIFTRSDFLYVCLPPPISLLTSGMNQVLIPKGEAYGGYSDRLAIVPAGLILQMLNITVDVVNNFNEWIDIFDLHRGGKDASPLYRDHHAQAGIEFTLWAYLHKTGIDVITFPHTAFTVHESTRNGGDWTNHNGKGENKGLLQYFGLTVKYSTEYNDALEQCDPLTVLLRDMLIYHDPEERTLFIRDDSSIYMLMQGSLHSVSFYCFEKMNLDFSLNPSIPRLDYLVFLKYPTGEAINC